MTVVDKAFEFEPDIEILKARLRHWFRFDSLQPEQGIALLIGVDPSEASALVNWYKVKEGDEFLTYRGLELLDGEMILIEIQQSDEATEKDKARVGALVRKHGYFLEYWRSGEHPERPSPAYFVEWAKLKGIDPSWRAIAVELQLIPGENLVKPSLNATSANLAKPLATTERNTLLTIIAALCDHASINHQDRGAAGRIVRMVETMGARMDEDTVRRALAKIPGALESRMK